ncbi:MAG: CopG family transcriptional regulator [bacterium]|nr:CopG family transcriptional regulator [bacterium]
MVRTQIQFEEAQHEQIRRLAHRQRLSISEAVRRLVRQGLRVGLDEEPQPRAAELLKVAGIGHSGLGDLGRQHDAYLAEDFDR